MAGKEMSSKGRTKTISMFSRSRNAMTHKSITSKGMTTKAFYWLIPLVALFLIAGYYSGFFTKVKDVVSGTEKYLPDVSVGVEEVKAGPVSLPEGQAQEIDQLRSTLESMMQSPKKNCFASFGGFKDYLGEGDASTVISITKTATASMQVLVNNHLNQVFTAFEFPAAKPCVIAGSKVITENFFQNFIDSKGSNQELKEPYLMPVDSLTISYQEGLGVAFAGNVVRVSNFGAEPVNDEGDNFENGGLLFKGPNNEICFFPTNYGADADADGIDNDYFTDSDEDSIPNKIKKGKLQSCY